MCRMDFFRLGEQFLLLFLVGLAESVDCSCLFESWAAVSSLDLLLVLIIQNHLLFIDIGLWFVIMTTNKSNKD